MKMWKNYDFKRVKQYMSCLRRPMRNESAFFFYLYNCNKRKIAIIYFGFITVSLILLFNMKGVSGVRISGRQDIIIIIFFIVLGINGFAILLTGISSFRKMLKKLYATLYFYFSKKSIYVQIVYSVYYSL